MVQTKLSIKVADAITKRIQTDIDNLKNSNIYAYNYDNPVNFNFQFIKKLDFKIVDVETTEIAEIPSGIFSYPGENSIKNWLETIKIHDQSSMSGKLVYSCNLYTDYQENVVSRCSLIEYGTDQKLYKSYLFNSFDFKEGDIYEGPVSDISVEVPVSGEINDQLNS
jgi:hypothetical protein